MSHETPVTNPENPELLNDNARKFITVKFDPEFLDKHNATSFVLTADWLVIDKNREEKLAYKDYGDGEVEILRIAKVTDQEGKRSTHKTSLTQEEYEALLPSAILHLAKIRHEFIFSQNDVDFSLKYDDFGNEFYMLEVDAEDDEARNGFNPKDFPYELNEVTGNLDYYGHNVVDTVSNT